MRKNSKPDGGVQTLGVQDPCQGEAFLTLEEREAVTVNGQLLKAINVEGEFMEDNHRETVFLT